MMKSNVAIELKRLRDRLPDWSLRKMAVELGYADGSSYQRYEDAEKMAGKPLPLHLAWRIIEKLEGKGQPPINRGEILALVGDDMSRHANVPLLPVEGLPIEGIVAAGVWA